MVTNHKKNFHKFCIIMVGLLGVLSIGSPALATSDNVLLRDYVLLSVETGLATISEIGADDILQAVEEKNIPQPLKQFIMQAVEVAQLDMSDEDKAEALMEVMATDCSRLFYATINAVAIDIFIDDVFINIPGIGTIINVLAGLTILCVLGII